MSKFEVAPVFERVQNVIHRQIAQIGFAVVFDGHAIRRDFPLNDKGLADANYLARSLNNVMEKLA